MKSWNFWETVGVTLAIALTGVANRADSLNASTDAPDIANAPATPVAAEAPAPADVHLSGPATEVVKLANSGVDQSVMLAFVTNSTSSFDLNAEQLIYLRDVGIPDAVVTAMMQQDQLLKTAAPAPASQPTPAPVVTAPPAEPEAPMPAPAAVAPAYDPNAAPPPAVPVAEAYPTFYSALAPYGTWIYVSGYGYCWQPATVVCDPGWRPYFDCGHWAYTDCGWYWASDYSWGWAPFHYGRWFRHARFGWCWAPDTVWGPSWVSWRYSDDYCGWAPLPPAACFEPAVGLTWCGASVAIGFEFGLGWDCFAFVGWHHFHDHHLRGFDLPPERATQIFNHTVVVNRIVNNHTTIINEGLPRERVVAATHTQLRQIALRDVSRPERTSRPMGLTGRSLGVYRPPLAAHTASTVAVASRVEGSRRQTGGSAGITHFGPRPAAASRLAEPSRSLGSQPVLSSAQPASAPRPAVRAQKPGALSTSFSRGPAEQRAQSPALAAAQNNRAAPAWPTPPVHRLSDASPSPTRTRGASVPAPVTRSDPKPARTTPSISSAAAPPSSYNPPHSLGSARTAEVPSRSTYGQAPRSGSTSWSLPRNYPSAAPETYKAPERPTYSAKSPYEPQRSSAPQRQSWSARQTYTPPARPSYSTPPRYQSAAPRNYTALARPSYPAASHYDTGAPYAPSARYTPPASSAVPRYRPEPSYAPQRSYAAGPSSWSSRPSYSPGYSSPPHYSAGQAMSAPSRGGEFRSNPSGGWSSSSSSDHKGHGGH